MTYEEEEDDGAKNAVRNLCQQLTERKDNLAVHLGGRFADEDVALGGRVPSQPSVLRTRREEELTPWMNMGSIWEIIRAGRIWEAGLAMSQEREDRRTVMKKIAKTRYWSEARVLSRLRNVNPTNKATAAWLNTVEEYQQRKENAEGARRTSSESLCRVRGQLSFFREKEGRRT